MALRHSRIVHIAKVLYYEGLQEECHNSQRAVVSF
jgi:hypothetical protein